jgi:hypothetical protein
MNYQIVVLFAILCVGVVSIVPTDHSGDFLALQDLFVATAGSSWLNSTNWLSPNASYCVWYGITCELIAGSNRVIQVTLNANNLTGMLPDSVGNLTQLRRLDAYHNQLYGTMPATIGSLHQLFYLDLYHNQLIGTVPASLAALNDMTWLYLNDNFLNGTIPAFLGRMPRLRELYLQKTSLQAVYPLSWATQPV